ncbi:hypothetical protein [Aureimonas sp. ME7]|uniref:hypothetical protein n=1 Tax=Aureimonas sp. ME7 TaxID=2744252 RepID=UPI0015F35FE6|nr:hypothetical protein [Aureimonas sp. ME7]
MAHRGCTHPVNCLFERGGVSNDAHGRVIDFNVFDDGVILHHWRGLRCSMALSQREKGQAKADPQA